MSLSEAVVLGVIQGVFEWLPVSSEAVISIVMTQLFGSGVTESLNSAIWLHTGTMLAAFIYFRKDFLNLINFTLERLKEKRFERMGGETEKLWIFLFVATSVTSLAGGAMYFTILEFLGSSPDLFAALTGFALLVTGLLRLYQEGSKRVLKEIQLTDSLFIGFLQAFSVIPGISRSGSTVFGLLYRDFSSEDAFRLSFLLSVPAVFAANIGLNLFSGFSIGLELVVASMVAFLTGYVSIDVVLKVADRVEAAYICFVLAAISFIPLIL